MILALALAATPPVADVPGTLPPQELASGCAAFLWSNGAAHRLIAMVTAAPPSLRVSIDNRVIDLPLITRRSLAPLGFAADADYAGPATATLTMTVVIDPALKDGARVSEALLSLARPGLDTVIVPASGLIGCAPAPAASPPSDETKVPG